MIPKRHFSLDLLCIYCGSTLSLVQILFSFVSNSLSYITIPKKQKNIKFEPRIKLNHDTYMYMYSVHIEVDYFYLPCVSRTLFGSVEVFHAL